MQDGCDVLGGCTARHWLHWTLSKLRIPYGFAPGVLESSHLASGLHLVRLTKHDNVDC